MLIVGFIVVGLALFVEFTFHPPYWVHALLWMPLILVLSLGLLRPLKGLLIAQQYKHRAAQAGSRARDGAGGVAARRPAGGTLRRLVVPALVALVGIAILVGARRLAAGAPRTGRKR